MTVWNEVKTNMINEATAALFKFVPSLNEEYRLLPPTNIFPLTQAQNIHASWLLALDFVMS